MSKIVPTILALMILAGCAQQPVNQSQAGNGHLKVVPKESPRVAFLKDQSLLQGIGLSGFEKVDSPFLVAYALEHGKLTVERLKGSELYFADPDGQDNGYFYNSTYLVCIQTTPLGEKTNKQGEKVKVSLGVYANPRLKRTVAVVWPDYVPKKGEYLNADFLLFLKIRKYDSKDGKKREMVTFIRPKWAGENGYSTYK